MNMISTELQVWQYQKTGSENSFPKRYCPNIAKQPRELSIGS